MDYSIFLFSLYSNLVFSVGIIDDFKTWLHEKIQTVINYIRDFFFDIFKAFTDFFKAMLLTVFDILKDIVYFVFDVFLGFVVGILSALSSLFSSINFANAFTNLPPEVLNMLGLLGLGECLGLIISSLIVRITLQLIPFTRLGS